MTTAQVQRIEERRLWSVSPSQVDSYRKCPRYWFNAYVLKDRGPTPEFMFRGTAIHAAIETYLKTGEVPIELAASDDPSGKLWQVMEFVQAAIPHLPKPIIDPYWDEWKKKGDGGLMLEQAGEIGTWVDPGDGSGGGPTWFQYIDLVEAYPDRATITDTKTTSDFRYAKTPEELSHNVQLIANAKWLFSISDYTKVTLRHLYLLTKTKRPKAMVVSVEVTREHVEAEWYNILTTVREMHSWAKLAPTTAEPLPPNTDHCSAYGGCQFRSKCGFDAPATKLFSIPKFLTKTDAQEKEGPTDMSLLDKMMKNVKAPAVPPATPPAAVDSAPAPVVAKKPGGLAALLGKAATPPAPAPEPTSAPAPEPTPEVLTPEKAQEAAIAAGYPADFTPVVPTGIIPPDAPTEQVASAPAATEPPKKERKKKLKIETPAEPAVGPEEITTKPQGTDQLAAALVQAPKAETLKETPAPAAETAPDQVLEELRKNLTTPDPSFACGVQALFVDCLPGKGWPTEVKDLGEYMHAFASTAAQSAKQVDYRLIRYESKGYLATAVRLLMKALPPAIYVDTKLPGADVFLEVVIPYCKMIVRGTR